MNRNKEAQLFVAVGMLIEAAADKDELVREAVTTSLRKLAKKNPSTVLKNAVEYRRSSTKLSVSHLSTLLRTMEQICQEHLPEIDGDVVLHLIKFCVDEMTKSSDYHPETQMPASGILVALGKAHCNEVMEGLLKHFQPGVLPHYCVLHTMGTLATANVFGIVPFAKATLGTMLPMIGMLKNDAMKQAFAYVLGKFSEAISEYLANIDHAPDPTVKRTAFSSEICIAYDVLANSWIQSRDPKVCKTVLNALGPMFALLPGDKVVEQTPRLVPCLLGLYRRHVDPYPITQCLAAVLLVAITDSEASLEPLLDNLLSILLELVCTSPDYAQPLTVKNHYEVLRCFDRIAGHYSERVVELLTQQLKNNNERERIKALFVLTHLINSSENLIQSSVRDIIIGLRNMLTEQSIKVKKVLLKAIVAFAYHGYLEGIEGKEFVEFIVKHCCTPPAPGGSEWEEMRSTCCNTLYLLATTVPQVEGTLWPLLLQIILAAQYASASPTVMRCLAHLASKQRDGQSYTDTGGKQHIEIPDSQVLLARSLALLGSPLESNQGMYVLNFLKNYAPNVSIHLKPLWEQKIPELATHLEESKDIWSIDVWEDRVLEFLSATLEAADEEKWTILLGKRLMEQAALYAGYHEQHSMLHKCVAVCVCHTTDQQYVFQQLDTLLGSARYCSERESQTAARAIGVCARSHPEAVLSRLDRYVREELPRKSSRTLLGFMRDTRHEGETERLRVALLLCYGQVATEAPAAHFLPRLEPGIAGWVTQQLGVAKDTLTRNAALNTLGSIAEALHPNRNSLHVVLQSRGEMLGLVLSQFLAHYSSQEKILDFYCTILQVATALVKLPPILSSEERMSILQTCFTKVYQAVAIETSNCKINITEIDGKVYNGMDIRWPDEVAALLMSLGVLVQELLLTSVTPATLDEIFTLLEPWLASRSSQQRAAAVSTLCSVLHCYLENVKFAYETPSKFSQTGLILGRVVPRCTDPNMAVRRQAIDCVRLVLFLAARYEGHMVEHDNDLASALSQLQVDIQTEDPQQLFKVTGDLAKVICSKLPHFQLMPFCESLMSGLLDLESSSSSGTSVVLNTFLKSKGGELFHHVSDILVNILQRLTNIQCQQTRTGSMRALLALANHHPKAVVSALLHQPLPFELSVVECWMTLAQDPELAGDIIEQFLRVIATTPLYEDQQDKEKLRIAVLLPLAAISAMKEMFRIAVMQDIVEKRFSELFAMLFIALGCYIGISPPIYTPQPNNREKHSFIPNRSAYKLNPARVAQEAFKSFLLCAKCQVVAEALLECTQMDAGENMTSFISMVPSLTRAVCSCIPQSLPKLITSLNQYGNSICEPQRITVTAFYAELVKMKGNGQVLLLESIMGYLLNCLTDPAPLVRKLCLNGIASISQLDQEQRGRYSDQVLAALIQGLDDHDSNCDITLEAVRGFSQMLQVVDLESIHSVQTTVSLRSKPFFDREDPQIREAAIRMFGDLAKYGGTSSGKAFLEQVNSNLVCFLLHLNDNNANVIKASKYTLRQISPLIGAERINSMIQDHLIEAANLHYSDFMVDLSKVMVSELPELVPILIMNALSYVKSPWSVIRGNAAMFIGLLYGGLSAEASMAVSLDTISARLIQLLKDEDPSVRAKAAKALSYVFNS